MNSQTLHFNNDYFQHQLLDKNIALALENPNPETGIEILLDFLGHHYACERTYIFEINYSNHTCSNTYEWCAENVIPQKENLQSEPLFQISHWMEQFKQKQVAVISDLEEIKYTNPATYAILKPQQIHSLIVAPIYSEDSVIGFVGMDNPVFIHTDILISALYFMANLLSYMLKTRDLIKHADYLEYHDQLTLALNQNALKRDLEKANDLRSFGVIICNLSHIQEIYDHDFEDPTIILEWNNILKRIFHQYKIYRIGNDIFVIMGFNLEKNYFSESIAALEEYIATNQKNLIFGFSWADTLPINLFQVFLAAKQAMYASRTHFYYQIDLKSCSNQNSHSSVKTGKLSCLLPSQNDSVLNNFIANNYFDLDIFFKSMSIGGLYPYFGDLTSDLWYISDSMRDFFGFKTNIVTDLLKKWEKFIPYKEDLDLYRSDVENIMTLKKEIHDLVYRINDKEGNELWIRCFGLITWNADRSAPLSFCGNVFRLNHAFIVDPITNLPREKPAIREIGKLQQLQQSFVLVCFRLNGFSEVNELRGRRIANNLLKDIGSKILKSFDKQIPFYRLDGLRFLAIIPPEQVSTQEIFLQKIKTLIYEVYSSYNLPVRTPCSIGVLHDINPKVSAQEIMTDVMSVLEIAKNSPEEILVHSSQTVRVHREKKQMVIDLSDDALNNFRNFRVLIQPIVSAKNHKIVGGEILLRWRYEGKDISPIVFIPILEETKLILPVGRWVFEQAVRHCKRICAYIPDFFADFNVSYYQINDDEFPAFMKSTLQKRELSSDHLIMELTETHYNDNPLKLQQFLDSCRNIGIQMALDDFGVGYSSLEMLLKYPAKVVKLDRSLMKKMSDSKDISDFITSIVYACRRFNKLVCVEGVETEKELQIVTEAGCDFIQGYYFYQPMELTDFYDLLIKE
ncbi:EAL domain-containing protein [Clostridiales bacterium COT073_COT-073]|nr:EAL domain-containing protein [Clostridiales bacterium COT073_COT-073]